MLTISTNARWSQNGVTVGNRYECGNAVNQLNRPFGLDIDDDSQSIVIADWVNDRIVDWKIGASNGKVIAGGRGQASRLDQLDDPTDVLIDRETNSLSIADAGNRRVLRWSRRQGTTQGEVIVDNAVCEGLAMIIRDIFMSLTSKTMKCDDTQSETRMALSRLGEMAKAIN